MLSLSCVLMGLAPALAQLVPPAEPAAGVDAEITRLDGQHIEGLVRAIDAVDGEMRLVVVDTEGHKHKILWSEIAELSQPLDLERQMVSVAARLEASGVRRQIWSRVEVPEAGRTELLPLLNPGLDALLRVYPDPLASQRPGRRALLSQSTSSDRPDLPSGAAALASGALLALPSGASAPIVVVYGSYAQRWEELFGGCEAYPRPEAPTYDRFAQEIAAHAAACGRQP